MARETTPNSTTGRALIGALLGTVGALVACYGDPVAPPEPGAKFCGAGTVRLEVGQVAVPIGSGAGGCTMTPLAGAEYALAWIDLRAISAAESGVEPVLEPYLVRVRSSESAPTASAGSPDVWEVPEDERPSTGVDRDAGPVHSGPVQLVDDVISTSRPRHRRTPLVLDEVFQLEDELSGLARPARVVRVYADGMVVVRWDEPPDGDFDIFLAQLDTAWAMVGSYARPALEATFAAGTPRSTAAGQTLILAQQQVAVSMRSFGEVSGDSLFVWLNLLGYSWTSATRMAQSLAHETAHLYQMMYMHASRPLPGQATRTGATFWGVEGGANLMSYEMLRRIANVAPDANHDWRAPAPSIAVSLFQLRAQPGGGVLTAGYDNAMGFMRDLITRRMEAGETHEVAMREVSRGVLEGWYGHDGVADRQGLVSRMRARLGAGWSASSALLDWALSYVGDDRTPNPIYQDRASLRVWDLPASQFYGWRADAAMTRTSAPFFFFKPYGSPGIAHFVDDGHGIFLDVAAPEVPIRWKVLRIR